jgi:hypothetical protein
MIGLAQARRQSKKKKKRHPTTTKINLRHRESNPGLLRDRQEY